MVRRVWVAVIALVALSGCGQSPAEELRAAARELHYRPVSGRLSGSSYALPPALQPSDEGATVAALKVRKVALRLRLSRGSEELRAHAMLYGGDTGGAKSLLKGMTSRGNASAAVWSDFAAVLHADAAPNDALQLSMALAAADRALDLDAGFPEALFNRAIVLETLSLRGEAAAAYNKYLQVDPSSQWATEARGQVAKIQSAKTRLAAWHETVDDLERAAEAGDELFINDIAITYPQEARSWAEVSLERWGERVLASDPRGAASMLTLCRVIGRALEKDRGESLLADAVRAIDATGDPRPLAKGHVAYGRGRKALARLDGAPEIGALKEAQKLFRAHGSPMALLARLQMEGAAPDGDLTGVLHDLAANAPPRYRALHGEVQWLLGLAAARGGSPNDALKSIRSATATFTALGEEQHADVTRDLTASLLSAAGDSAAAWRMRHASFVSAADSGNDYALIRTVSEAARDAMLNQQWDIAHALLNVVAGTSHPIAHLRTQAMTWRVVAAKRAHMPRTAAADLNAARAAERMSDDLRLVEALVAEDPRQTVDLLTESLRVTQEDTATARLLLERARAFQTTHQPERATNDLERAVALLEGGSVFWAPAGIRDAVVGPPSEAYCMLADTLDKRGDPGRALEMLERFRMWPQLPQNRLIPLHADAPAGTVVINYGLFPDRVLIYANDTRTSVSVGSVEVQRLVATFAEAIESNNLRSFRDTGRALSRILVDPIASVARPGDILVFVLDPALRQLPFAALLQDNGRYLIEDHAVVVTPSLTSWLRSLHTDAKISRALLSVGNPFPVQAGVSLAGAEAEAKEIAALYPSRALLVGAAATKQRVISALDYSDAAHFAVHANAGLGEAMPPHLLLSESKDNDGKLTAAEIAALQLENIRIVVLAGCRTAVTTPVPSSTRSLVEAFLAAGAGSVIGTLWEVDDAATREMSIRFHRASRSGATPAGALRTTQMEMIRSAASPRVWAAMQLYGSGF